MKNDWTPDDTLRMLANPFYCITVHPTRCEPHSYIVDEETWIKAGARAIEENGAEAFLRHLLENLKGIEWRENDGITNH